MRNSFVLNVVAGCRPCLRSPLVFGGRKMSGKHPARKRPWLLAGRNRLRRRWRSCRMGKCRRCGGIGDAGFVGHRLEELLFRRRSADPAVRRQRKVVEVICGQGKLLVIGHG